MTLFTVLSNLNHDGVLYKVGQTIEGDLKQFEHLLADQIVKLVDDVEKTVEESENKVTPPADTTAPEDQKPADVVPPADTTTGDNL